MTDLKVIVDGSIEDDSTAFLDAWQRAERGESVNERVLAFESWGRLTVAMIARWRQARDER